MEEIPRELYNKCSSHYFQGFIPGGAGFLPSTVALVLSAVMLVVFVLLVVALLFLWRVNTTFQAGSVFKMDCTGNDSALAKT